MASSQKASEKPSNLAKHDDIPATDIFRNSSWFSYMFFSFASSLISLGNSRLLQLKDLRPVPAECKSEMLMSRFVDAWEAQKKGSKRPSIVFALYKCFWRDIIKIGVYALFKTVGVLSGPVFIYLFIEYTTGYTRFKHEGLVLIISLFTVKFFENIAQRHWFFSARIFGRKVESTLQAAIYQKVLCLSSKSRQRHTTGEIANYISVDVFRLSEFAWKSHWCCTTPIIIAGAISIAFFVVGIASVPTVITVVVVIVSSFFLAKSMHSAQQNLMATQDERLRATSQILQGMKVIKLQAWEESFGAFIQQTRENELTWLAKTQQKRSYATIIYWLLPTQLICIVLIASLFMKITLTAKSVFTVLASFRIIQDPCRIMVEAMSSLIHAQTSFSRLEQFLQEEDLPSEAPIKAHNSVSAISNYVIVVDDASMSWNSKETRPTLSHLNMVVKHGEKLAVCGAVGAGKSSLLLALLGEISKLSGSVYLSGSIAYVPQTAWIQSMTIRDNITFGEPFDSEKYKRTMQVCALNEDLKSLSNGDLTEIGERGTNLSGGQKQRIQLARAVYSDADIYLLDDPFSAVDAQTASALFHECVMGALKDKTVVLVTHQMEFLPSVDIILVMHDGEIKQVGAYNELLTAGDLFQELVSAHEKALHTVIDDKRDEGIRGQEKVLKEQFRRHLSNVESISASNQLLQVSQGESQKDLSKEESLSGIKHDEASYELLQDENIVTAKMRLKPYLHYIQISKAQVAASLSILSQLVFTVTQLLSNIWLARAVSISTIRSQVLVGVYCALSLACTLVFTFRNQMIIRLGLQASKFFFNRLMASIMKAPMAFFDTTPSGRILNRASGDVSVIDLDIPFTSAYVLATALDVICIIIVTCIVTWEIVFIVMPVLIVTSYLQTRYNTAARELNRINSATKAPIVNSSVETMNGSATIRAFKKTRRFKKGNLELIDRDASAYLSKYAALEWMVMRIDLSCTCVLIVAACLVLFQSSTSGGLSNLSITYALTFNVSLVQFCVWQGFSSIFVISIERIKQYLELPKEALAVVESNRPPSHWPTEGKISFDSLQIRYRDNSPLVLKGITCTFMGGQKIGVVGRTGSGKTTLISALFRLVEPAAGRIYIDDIDIVSIGLHDLRMKLGIIPQEPILFQGTIRTNLDPLNQYSDLEIWEALRKCQLREVVEKLPLSIESSVNDQGENWSVGQRQLFCLGRVLLKKSQVLVLDEATASIDSANDALLQSIIHDEFSTCTVVTVAHRIPTVIDADMVLALHDGIAMEFDSPQKLIKQEASLFSQLVAEYWAQAARNSMSHEHAYYP